MNSFMSKHQLFRIETVLKGVKIEDFASYIKDYDLYGPKDYFKEFQIIEKHPDNKPKLIYMQFKIPGI